MIVTTSRRPCAKSRNLCKELVCVIPLSRYVLRGKKGVRDLVHLSVEKGADRVLVVTSKGDEPFSLQFYAGWDFLGELLVSVVLRRELDIPKVLPIKEDIPFLMQWLPDLESENEKEKEETQKRKAATIADLFGAEQYRRSAYSYMVYHKGWIDFYRLDVSDTPVGPRIQVNVINYAGDN